MNDNVSIVIVSHSPDVARGAAEMVRQMVGEEIAVAFCGGNPEGGLGTDVGAIMAAIESVWSDKGVAVLVDLGGAETNSEMAIEMLGPERTDDKMLTCASLKELDIDPEDARVELLGSTASVFVTATNEGSDLAVENVKAGDDRLVYVTVFNSDSDMIGNGCKDQIKVPSAGAVDVTVEVFACCV